MDKPTINEELYGKDMFGEVINPRATGAVTERFVVPPFSVLDARQGYWQDRKRAWLNRGIESEIGRYAKSNPLSVGKGGLSDRLSGAYSPPKGEYDYPVDALKNAEGTSIFDPVLCEIAYRWFCPLGGQIVDPFAGGSVRGVIAALMGHRYWGCELRPEQVDANMEQANKICDDLKPDWHCGDSADALEVLAPMADFIFSCPPYGNLEVYSDIPGDLSNMTWEGFTVAYRNIIRESLLRLKNNRFACFVVGDFRSKDGFLRNFVSKTIEAFELGGASLYNEAILVTAIGSAPIRVTKQFNAGRKMCKTHQNVLVFCKGDWKEATKALEGLRELDEQAKVRTGSGTPSKALEGLPMFGGDDEPVI